MFRAPEMPLKRLEQLHKKREPENGSLFDVTHPPR